MYGIVERLGRLVTPRILCLVVQTCKRQGDYVATAFGNFGGKPVLAFSLTQSSRVADEFKRNEAPVDECSAVIELCYFFLIRDIFLGFVSPSPLLACFSRMV